MFAFVSVVVAVSVVVIIVIIIVAGFNIDIIIAIMNIFMAASTAVPVDTCMNTAAVLTTTVIDVHIVVDILFLE